MRCRLCREQIGPTLRAATAHMEIAHPNELAAARAMSTDSLIRILWARHEAEADPIVQEWEETGR